MYLRSREYLKFQIPKYSNPRIHPTPVRSNRARRLDILISCFGPMIKNSAQLPATPAPLPTEKTRTPSSPNHPPQDTTPNTLKPQLPLPPKSKILQQDLEHASTLLGKPQQESESINHPTVTKDPGKKNKRLASFQIRPRLASFQIRPRLASFQIRPRLASFLMWPKSLTPLLLLLRRLLTMFQLGGNLYVWILAHPSF